MTDAGSDVVEEVLAKSTDITVNAEPLDYAPWVYFWMSAATYPKQGGKKQGEYLKFDKKAGSFDLTFRLNDTSGLHLKFYKDFDDAMWVSEGPACPPAGRGNGGGAIRSGPVEDFVLKATNVNGTAQLLTFMLRFDGDTNGERRPPYEYDPKIINGGG